MIPSALSAIEARRLIGQGQLLPVELVDSCIAQIERLDPMVNAMITRSFERARREAFKAELAITRGDALGALHGLVLP